MKFLAAAAALLTVAAPATAGALTDNLNRFCNNVHKLNTEHNVSVAPGTPGASAVKAHMGEHASDYEMVWHIARRSGTASSCSKMY